MRTVRREWYGLTRTDEYHIIPIGDIHIGNAGCDEALLQQVVKRVQDDPCAYWVGMGDYCDYINMKDPRFSPASLAPWMTVADMCDIAKAERDHLLDIIKPIAPKCLALVCGNHETSIMQHSERDVFSEIVSEIKKWQGCPAEKVLGVGIYGWLQLCFYRSDCAQAGRMFNINLHHGFTGGKLAGAKALDMQRWLWTHDAEIVIMGHCHGANVQWEQVEGVDKNGNLVQHKRVGVYSGTFLGGVIDQGPATYAEAKGYLPLPIEGNEIDLYPVRDIEESRKVRVLSGL